MSFDPKNIGVLGGSSVIGSASTRLVSRKYSNANLFSRNGEHSIDYRCEDSIAEAAGLAAKEKSLQDLSAEKFHNIFEVNTIISGLIVKRFLPKMNKEQPSILAALSARVASILGNHLGGWYAYHASKVALNMIIRNTAIEVGRLNKQSIIIGLHSGTVDRYLSKPFQENVADGKLFTPKYSSKKMLEVLENFSPKQTERSFAWDGKKVLQ